MSWGEWWEETDLWIKVTLSCFVVLVLATGLYYGYAQAFGTRFEDLRRDQYEHSRSYVEGSIRDLNNLCLEASKADAGHKPIIYDTIRNRYVKLDVQDIPDYLRSCLSDARSAQ